MSDSFYYYQPEYYQKFRCMGGDCPESCCYDWNIIWTKKELDRLKSAEMSDKLRQLIDKSFILYDNNASDSNQEKEKIKYKVILNEKDQECPFHDNKTGLCLIQREVGEEYFGNTCSSYPRRLFIMPDKGVVRECSLSCPAVIKRLIHDKHAIKMETIPINKRTTVLADMDSRETLAALPFLKFRRELIDYYNWVFSSELSFEDAMLMGVIAAYSYSEPRNQNDIPMCVDIIKKEIKESDVHRVIDKVEPNYKLKYSIARYMIYILPQKNPDHIPISIFKLLEGEDIDVEKLMQGKKKFYEKYPNGDSALKNVAFNLFLDRFLFADFSEYGFSGFYLYFCVCMTAVSLIAYAAGYSDENKEEDLIVSLSRFIRPVSHNNNYVKAAIDFLEKHGSDSAEFIATFLK